MLRLFYWIVSTVFIFCLMCSQTSLPQDKYKLTWDNNSELDMSHYEIFAWHGADTLQSPFRDDTPADSYSRYLLKKNIPYHKQDSLVKVDVDYVANGDWIQFAVTAVNKRGIKSNIAVTPFIRSEDLRTREKHNL